MKKYFWFLFIIFSLQANAVSVEDLKEPKPFLGRMANTDKVETVSNETDKKITEQKAQMVPIKEMQVIEAKNQQETNSNYADLSLQKLAQDVSYELDLDSAKTNADLNILWNAAASRSETMKYTIYKLSNPDEDKPSESAIKKILKPIAGFSSLAGASFAGDPYTATGALIGGGLINAFMKDDKELNYKFSKVSDADMVLLVRKIDGLQKKLIDLYMDYKTKEQLLVMMEDNCKKREDIYKNSQNKTIEEITIADVYYRDSKTNAQRARDEFLTSRAILENLVGSEAIKKIEE